MNCIGLTSCKTMQVWENKPVSLVGIRMWTVSLLGDVLGKGTLFSCMASLGAVRELKVNLAHGQ